MALWLASIGLIPPEQWHHQPNIVDKWQCTVAMYLAYNQIIPPTAWEHDSEQKSLLNETVALLLAKNGIRPPIQWYHDKLLRTGFQISPQQFYYFTVKNFLQYKRQPVPKEWDYDMYNEDESTDAIEDAKKGIIPELGNNRPEYQNINGYTVAMNLAKNGIIPPDKWCHNPLLCNNQKQTVAILLAINGIIPSSYWLKGHNVNQKDRYGNSVKNCLENQGFQYTRDRQFNKK